MPARSKGVTGSSPGMRHCQVSTCRSRGPAPTGAAQRFGSMQPCAEWLASRPEIAPPATAQSVRARRAAIAAGSVRSWPSKRGERLLGPRPGNSRVGPLARWGLAAGCSNAYVAPSVIGRATTAAYAYQRAVGGRTRARQSPSQASDLPQANQLRKVVEHRQSVAILGFRPICGCGRSGRPSPRCMPN